MKITEEHDRCKRRPVPFTSCAREPQGRKDVSECASLAAYLVTRLAMFGSPCRQNADVVVARSENLL